MATIRETEKVRLRSRIPEIVGRLDNVSEAVALDVARETATLATSLAPDAPPIGKGLVDSIEAKPVSGGAGVYAAWYWFFPEFGTVKAPPHPYMTPAYEAAFASVDRLAHAEFAVL